MNTTPPRPLSPPQVPLAAFLKPIDFITESHIPGNFSDLIDSLFNASQARQIKAAFRFFGLMTEHGQPTNDLWRLQTRKERKAVLRELLLSHYAFVLPDLERVDVTEEEIEADFVGAFAISGSSIQSAVAFFVYLAQYVGLPLPPQLTRTSGRTKLRNVPPDMETETETQQRTVPLSATLSGHGTLSARLTVTPSPTRTIRLPSGGSVTLSVNVDWFEVGEDERTFLLSLIDTMRRYEQTLVQGQENAEEVDDG